MILINKSWSVIIGIEYFDWFFPASEYVGGYFGVLQLVGVNSNEFRLSIGLIFMFIIH